MVGLSLGTYWDIFLILNLFKTKSEPRLLGINGKIKIQSCIIIKNSSNVVIFFFFSFKISFVPKILLHN